MRISLLFAALLVASPVLGQFGPYHMLHHWELSKNGTDQPLGIVEIPGNLHMDLHKLGVIEDPMIGSVENEIQWVGESDWVYVHTFEVDLKSGIVENAHSSMDHGDMDHSKQEGHSGPDAMGHDKMNQNGHEGMDHSTMDHGNMEQASGHEGHMMHKPLLVEGGHQELVFTGLDTYADVYLNDQLILQADNMFREWPVNIEGKLINGTNKIKVVFKAPEKLEGEKVNKKVGQLPGGSRVYSRKAQYHYGWDWGPKYITAGLYKNAFIRTWNDARITDVYYETISISENKAELKAHVTIESDGHHLLTLQSGSELPEFKIMLHVKEGKQIIEVPIIVENPELWWSKGMGDAHLYRFQVELLKGEEKISHDFKQVGLRTIELVNEEDEFGESFYFRLNGKKVYAKGANYIPQSSFVFGYIPDYIQFFKDVERSNINMLRVWGGGIYEFDVFYDFCNRNGIMVWQDFMFACAMYPADEEFIANVEEEAEFQVKRLRNNPSLALWCGNNEVAEGWERWGWKDGFKRKQQIALTEGYDKLFNKLLPEITEKLDPDVAYVHSSPRFGRGDSAHLKEGDAHDWWVWHDGYPFSHFEEEVPRFMSEFGFQSYPDIRTINEYYEKVDKAGTAAQILNPNFAAHQNHPRGDGLIKTYIERDFELKEEQTLANYILLSQFVQANGIKKGIEAQRRNPKCMGSLYWQINDVWPATSWSGIDYKKRWKAIQYAVKDVYKDVIISIEETKAGEINVWVVNDRPTATGLVLEVQTQTYSGDSEVLGQARYIDVPAGSTEIYYSTNKSVIRDTTAQFIHAELRELGAKVSETNRYFARPKYRQLEAPNFTRELFNYTEKSVSIRVEASKPAMGVFYSASVEGWFDDNSFDLMPGEAKVIVFYPNEPVADWEGFKLEAWSIYNMTAD
ncbi:MAG: beta-mannosidase [Limisphaerales bacterium]|jgi:beta-mannosidase